MTNLKDKATNVIFEVKRKALPVAMSAMTAMSGMAVTAFAAEGGTVDYTSLSTSITDAFKTIVSNCIDIAVAVLPIGIGLIGLQKMWDVAKKFFTKATS